MWIIVEFGLLPAAGIDRGEVFGVAPTGRHSTGIVTQPSPRKSARSGIENGLKVFAEPVVRVCDRPAKRGEVRSPRWLMMGQRAPGGTYVAESRATDDITAMYDDGILEVRVPVDTDRTDVTTVPIKNRR